MGRSVENRTEYRIPCPKVSVIMPAYNSEEFIEQAIRSALNQTYSNLEVIVIDDNSNDGTNSIVKKLADEDDRVILVRNEHNLGAAQSRNKGMDLCRGEYVALLDSDDVWYPEKLEVQMELAQKENADIVYCSYAITDEKGQKKCPDFIVSECASLESTIIKSEISCSTAILGPGVIKGYRFPHEYYHEDLALWLRLLKDGMKAVGTKQVLAEYRLRGNSRAANKMHVAKQRWIIYRSLLGLSAVKSSYCLLRYAVGGFLKYRESKR